MTQFYSRNDTVFNGDVYSIPFSYSKEEEINVFIDEELYTDWQFLNESQIQLLNIPSTVTSTSIISVRRITDISEKIVDYTNNSLLNKENLNKSQDQLLQAVQEIYDNNVQFGIDVDNILVENKAEMDAVIEQNKQEILGIQSQFEEETNATIAKNRQEILTIQSQFEKETNDTLDEYKEITDAKVAEIDRVAKSVVETANNALATSKEAEQTADSAVSKADSAVSTANSANTTANRAETIANTANETSNQAVTIANTATNTSNQALETANTALQNSASAVNTANTSSSKVDMFGESIETVLEAAEKIFELDESVQTAVQAAELANQAAESATQAAEDAISTLDSKADKTDIKNGKLTIQANGSTVATFTANQEGDSTANIVIPDSAQWGKITGTLSNQTDLQNALNGKLSTTGTADKALKDSNGLQISTNYMRKTIGDAWIPATPTAPTALAMVGRQGCGNGNIAGGNLVSLHKNTLFRCYERGSTITCNYEDKVANLGKTMCDGSFSGHYTQINPSTSFTSKPFVWEVTSPTQYEVSDVCRLHIYSHRLTDALNVTKFKIEAYIQDTLTNSKKWVTVYEYSGESKNIAQTGFGLYKTGYSSTYYYSIFGIRLTISGSPDTVFRMSQVQIVASRGTETLADSLQCVSNAGGKIWGNLEVTGTLKSSNTYNKTEVNNITDTKVDLDGGNYIGSELEDVVEQTHWKKKITNCLLEVPQRIKYDLTDGVLTIKAGSQVIVPYGNLDRTFYKVGDVAFDETTSLVSNFSGTGYIETHESFTLGNSWEIVTKFTTGADITANQNVFNNGRGVALNVSNSKLALYLGSDGSTWNVLSNQAGTTTLTVNTTYYVKVSYNGTSYTMSLSTDGKAWNNEHTLASTAVIHSNTKFKFGQYGTNIYFRGSIDFPKTLITINGELRFNPAERLTIKYPVGATFLNDNFKVVDTQYEDGKFFVWAELVEDVVRNAISTTNTTERWAFLRIDANGYDAFGTGVSGTEAVTNSICYRTDLNKCVCYNTSGAVKSEACCLPFMKVLANGIYVEGSVTQLFNGMGYIGSTVWVDKGVKGLIPNGRNEDGTLKNIEFEVPSIIIGSRDLTQKSIPVWYQSNNTIVFSKGWEYVEATNKVTEIQDGVTTQDFCQIATVDMEAGVISNFQPKQPFHAVDFNELKREIDNVVPVGSVIAFGENSKTPTGYLYCNGAAVSRTTYAALFNVIGTSHGTGDGSTTFNLPNYTGCKFVTSTNVAVFGDGKSLGLNNGSVNIGLGNAGSGIGTYANKKYFHVNRGTNSYETYTTDGAMGVSTSSSTSGLKGTVSAVAFKWYIKY